MAYNEEIIRYQNRHDKISSEEEEVIKNLTKY